ncbi:unnamed protein product [Ceutorhynchus assimilis]|uniref:E3 ubiquitin-protein ligase n=1 Tax=Ceutorhynchus assimilis TaxID=467358 RepID=A0A9N9MUC7_9CUCU|nr:unnamed protein product [Ceutorhynchus assimilis]
MNGDSSSTFIQQATLEKLKCTRCQKYLSILPIHRNLQGDIICGRCPIDDASGFIRDELYESAIEFQKFPCTNRGSGCLEVLSPAKLAEHEKCCHYMKHECPTKVYNNCTWEGNLVDVLDHFEKAHPTFILKDCKYEIDLQNNHKENYLMPYADGLYVITREGNSLKRTFSVIVKCLSAIENTADNLVYSLTLESGNKAHKYIQEEVVGNKLEFQGDIVKDMLHDPITIIANISIKEKPETNASVISSHDSEEDDGLDLDLLHEFECPICMEYMVPPIYQCEIGHSFCQVCKDTQTVCPSCKAEFKRTQNFTLERVIMNTIYPCKHSGCKYKTKAKNIRQHEATCLWGPFECPLKDFEKCSTNFRASELFNHIKNEHYESLLELDTVSVPFNTEVDEDILEAFILKHGQYLFKLCFKYECEEQQFCWSVQLVGPPEESAKYMFELEIIDGNGKNLRLYIKANCAPLCGIDSTFDDENSIYVDYEQIEAFIKNQLTYRILITKKC